MHAASTNTLLAALPRQDWRRIEPVCMRVRLLTGDRLIDAGRPYDRVFFPISGVISATFSYESGTVAQLAFVGREGVSGLGLAFGSATALCDHVVQIPGEAVSLRTEDFRTALEACETLRPIVLAYAHALFAETLFMAGCARVHSAESRAACHLLRCHDRCDGDRFRLTQQSLAMMLGVSRESVNAAARHLQARGRIRYRYGSVTIDDRAGLERDACECYGLVRRGYDNAMSRWLG